MLLNQDSGTLGITAAFLRPLIPSRRLLEVGLQEKGGKKKGLAEAVTFLKANKNY